jgi:hypothetical protein
MKKTSIYLMATAIIIIAGTAFIAHSWNQENRGFLGRITGGATDVAAAAVDLPEKVVTGEPMSLDQEERGALGTVVGGAGDVAAATVDVPENAVRGGRRYRYNDMNTEMDAYDDEEGGEGEEEEEEEIFPN